jgi:hypothetical protein
MKQNTPLSDNEKRAEIRQNLAKVRRAARRYPELFRQAEEDLASKRDAARVAEDRSTSPDCDATHISRWRVFRIRLAVRGRILLFIVGFFLVLGLTSSVIMNGHIYADLIKTGDWPTFWHGLLNAVGSAWLGLLLFAAGLLLFMGAIVAYERVCSFCRSNATSAQEAKAKRLARQVLGAVICIVTLLLLLVFGPAM